MFYHLTPTILIIEVNKNPSNLLVLSSNTRDDIPRRSVKDRLGERRNSDVNRRLDFHQEEQEARFDWSQLDFSKNKQKNRNAVRPFEPFRQGFAPQKCSKFNREVWKLDQDRHPQDKETDELGGIDSSDHKEKQE